MCKESMELSSRSVMEAVWDTHANRDYSELLNVFGDVKSTHIPDEEQFNDAVDRAVTPLGKFNAMRYLGQVNKAKAGEVLVLWKITFEATDEELLWHIYLDGENNLTAIWFG